MDRVRNLTADQDYRRYLAETEKREVDRLFCRHDFSHLLDVARIAWILCLEQGKDIARYVVYAAALLHDIGRFMQYDNPAVDHALASAELAGPLLDRHGFAEEETVFIREAIACHRLPPKQVEHPLGRILAEADDLSRRCVDCHAREGCYKVDRMAASLGIQY
jgi:HD superfamily phosphodiesterase